MNILITWICTVVRTVYSPAFIVLNIYTCNNYYFNTTQIVKQFISWRAKWDQRGHRVVRRWAYRHDIIIHVHVTASYIHACMSTTPL